MKGDAYEGLLQKNAEDVKGGAGQYFTPRPLIAAMVDVMRPAAGTGDLRPGVRHGRLPARGARLHRASTTSSTGRRRRSSSSGTFFGIELVDSVARLCAMNLLLHGIGADRSGRGARRHVDDALGRASGGELRDGADQSAVRQEEQRDHRQRGGRVVARNRSSSTATTSGRRTSNKQLNFLQHVITMLKQHGRAAVVLPDNVLFEGGAGETIRRELLKQADVHTLLRLPTGIFYAQGVKANVLFFDRKPAQEKPWTEKLWIYDLRTNQHFTLKENPLKRTDLDDFVACYHPKNRHERTARASASSRFTYDELIKRDKVNLDIFWLKDESLEDSANLPAPEVIAAEIVEDLEAALEQFAEIAEDLRQKTVNLERNFDGQASSAGQSASGKHFSSRFILLMRSGRKDAPLESIMTQWDAAQYYG